MEEGAHPYGHRPHGTGFHWLDISLALSAFLVSLASLWLTIHNARTMEKLVASNSYPNIDFSFDNEFDFQDGRGLRRVVNLSLGNTGIGGRLRSMELSFAGRAWRRARQDRHPCLLLLGIRRILPATTREPNRVKACRVPAVPYAGD